ncbi:MAG: endonuclease domain-containing protein [Oscillospiraceae bacterium]|nr:endonuclease domain-containing protein [Oscillospiraceae bacterium]
MRKHNPELTGNARQLRKNMTPEERILWYQYLRNYPVKFYRQRVLGNYIADFYCAKAKLVVELDGSQHYEAPGLTYDKLRTERLEELGLTVLRVPNNEVKRNLRGVCEAIDELVRQAGAL